MVLKRGTKLSYVIELEDITKDYRMGENIIHVLRGVSVKIEEGELLAIMGPSGSGKSTMMNTIGLLDKPSGGRYVLKGKDVSALNSDELANLRNHTIGFIFQAFFLLPKLTALQNVSMPMTYRSDKSSDTKKRALECLDMVGIKHLASHKPAEMSGGQQQRVAIARAIVGKPSIILADEPTGALDTKTSDEVMKMLIDINQNSGATVIIITHDPEVAEQCQRIIHIRDGLVAEGHLT